MIDNKEPLQCLNNPRPLIQTYDYLFFILTSIFIFLIFVSLTIPKSTVLNFKNQNTLDKMKENIIYFIKHIHQDIHYVKKKIYGYLFDNQIINDTLIIRKYKPVYFF